MNKTSIQWENPKEGWKLDYTINPIVGCKKGCRYCYAKRMNHRYKWIPEWTEPVFYPQRVKEIYKLKNPATIFIGSMSDVFGQWIPDEWIEAIIKTAKDNEQHRFMFLTKNPSRYSQFVFPENCWLGTTIISEKDNNLDAFYEVALHQPNKTFISIEPLLGGGFNKGSLVGFSLIIVGAQTGPGAIIPKSEWVGSIEHDNIFYKPSIRKYI